MSEKKQTLRIVSPDASFVLPYIERELPGMQLVDDPDADYTVFITQDKTLLEQKPSGSVGLFCPAIVGTGMTGIAMTLAKAIAGGRLYHITGNEARVSTVHAVDVARAVKAVLGSEGDFTVTDGCDPTFHDLAEALAHRLDSRRIYTVKPRLARWIMSGALRELITTDHVENGEDFARKFDFKPVSVVEYLKTHIYDDDSL